ncbi:MAG TPA: hypothetical protein VJ831_01075 [Jatrophihabitantaceae bacterium]|nr:hypothetical protein [Jatrophihabitantaceae bacterium]
MPTSERRRRFQLTRRRKRALGWLAVLLAFVAALTAWSTGPTDGPHVNVPKAGDLGITAPTSQAPSTLPATRPSKTGKPGPGDLFKLLPNLPQNRNVNPADLPARSVVMTATSDRPILRMGYEVLYGHPDRSSAINIASPMSVTTVGRGYGLVAAFAVQASPIATYVTCTVTVDGHLHSSHRVRGGYSVVVCVG